MDLRNVTTIGSATGVARLVLVVAALVGFLAMHGLDATDAAGSHHAVRAMPDQHAADLSPALISAHQPAAASSPTGERGQHETAMAGCVFVLLALTAGLALRALSTTDNRSTSGGAGARSAGHQPARAPPCPVFISLCVFRL